MVAPEGCSRFRQRERFGADIESAGVVDDLVDGDLGMGNVEQAVDHSVDLLQLAHIITGETLVRAARTFAGMASTSPAVLSHAAIVGRDGVRSGPTVSNKW